MQANNYTMQENNFPKEVKAVADREERFVMHVCNTKEKIKRDSCIDKKKSGKKNVIVLSTMHDNVKITKEAQRTHNA